MTFTGTPHGKNCTIDSDCTAAQAGKDALENLHCIFRKSLPQSFDKTANFVMRKVVPNAFAASGKFRLNSQKWQRAGRDPDLALEFCWRCRVRGEKNGGVVEEFVVEDARCSTSEGWVRRIERFGNASSPNQSIRQDFPSLGKAEIEGKSLFFNDLSIQVSHDF